MVWLMLGTLETVDLVWSWWKFEPTFTVFQTVQLFSLIFCQEISVCDLSRFSFLGEDDDDDVDDEEGSSGEDDDEVVEAEGTSCNL